MGSPLKLELIFITPPIHDLPTGGNIYNRRMSEALQNVEEIQVTNHISNGGEALGTTNRFAVAIVDSLLVGLERPEEFDGVWCLLVHYLTICDPSASEVEKRRQEREWLGQYDVFITTSQYTKNCLIKAGISPDRVHVVYPGLDEIYRTHEKPAMQSVDTCRLLTVASLLPGKGLLECLDVLEALSHLSWTWNIVGEGSLNPSFTTHFLDRLAGSPVADRVFWEGPQEEEFMPEVYRSHDLLLVSSRFETLGMSIREAMASGLPVIAYDVGGISESLLAGGGILVDPFHQDRLQKEVARLLASPEDRVVLGEMGIQVCNRFPSWEESAKNLADLLYSYI